MSRSYLLPITTAAFFCAGLLTNAADTKTSAPSRPPIVGVAHIAVKTDDIAAARQFYGTYLGFEEPFKIDKPAGGLMLTFFKVNDHQYIEVFPELKSPTEDRLAHIAFETTDIEQL